MPDMRNNVLPILQTAAVDLVLSGHSHLRALIPLLWTLRAVHYPHNQHDKAPGDANFGGDGVYTKFSSGQHANDGTVYAVVGSSGTTGGGPLNHPVMVTSLNLLGSMVLEIYGDRLDAVFLDCNKIIGDSFTIIKAQTSASMVIASFSGGNTQKGILLGWQSVSELNYLGLNVHRRPAQAQHYINITPTPISGYSMDSYFNDYRFLDDSVEDDHTYWYFIETIHVGGVTQRSHPIAVTFQPTIWLTDNPVEFALHKKLSQPFQSQHVDAV